MKITDLSELSAVAPGDYVHVVDVSDTSQNPAGSSRKVKLGNLHAAAPGRAQLVATRGHMPNNRFQDATYRRLESRHKHYLGCQDVSQLQIVFCNFAVPTGGAGEVSGGNDVSYDIGVELDSPSASILAWSRGLRLLSLNTGAPATATDPIGYDFAAGGAFWVRLSETSAAANQFTPFVDQSTAPDETNYASASGTSQATGTGAMSLPGGGAGKTDAGIAAAIIGRPSAPMPAVIILGDSIAQGTTDVVDAYGNCGYIARGLWNVNGYPVPWHKQTSGGDKLGVNDLVYGSRKRSFWPYATHLICELGWNDVAQGATLAAMQAQLTAIWRAAKRTIGPYGKPMKVAQTLITPGTNSSDGFATANNQTFRTGFAPGGVRDQLNAWINAQVGQGLLDSVINPNAYLEDGSSGKFVTNGTANYPTADGIHPSPALHSAMAAAVNDWALTLTV